MAGFFIYAKGVHTTMSIISELEQLLKDAAAKITQLEQRVEAIEKELQIAQAAAAAAPAPKTT